MSSAAKPYNLANKELSGSTDSANKASSPKRLFDITVALLLLVPGLPLIALLIVIVRLTSRGPGIYKQVRVGLNGETFTLYKLRSMRVDAETGSGAIWSTGSADNRVTRLGKFLRFSHLDEIPQLFNVLKGEMSLVGPRPERPEITPVLEESIPRYAERTRVLPGITGFAQLNLPPDTDLDSVRKKLVMDIEYIDRRTMWFDTRILLCTFRSFLFLDGPWILEMFGVYGTPSEEAVNKLHFDKDVEPEDISDSISEPDASEKHESENKPATPLVASKSDFADPLVNGHKSSVEISARTQAPELDSSIITFNIDSNNFPNNPR